MCVDGAGFAIFGIAISVAAVSIANMYFTHKDKNKNG